MGVTCSARDRGWLSLSHSVALNLDRRQTDKPRFAASLSKHNCKGTRWHGCFVLLDFAGQLDRTPNVATIQVELRVEVLLSCDGRGVVRTGTLGHVTLTGTQSESYVQRRSSKTAAWAVGGCDAKTLTPLWAVCCSAIPRKDCRGVFEPEWDNNVERLSSVCSVRATCGARWHSKT